MRRKSAVRAMVVLAAVALTAAACSSSRGGSSTSQSVQSGGATTTSAASGTKFGSLDSPCGKGNAKGATEQGVTDTAIHIGDGGGRRPGSLSVDDTTRESDGTYQHVVIATKDSRAVVLWYTDSVRGPSSLLASGAAQQCARI